MVRSDSGYILKLEPVGFAHGLDEKRQGFFLDIGFEYSTVTLKTVYSKLNSSYSLQLSFWYLNFSVPVSLAYSHHFFLLSWSTQTIPKSCHFYYLTDIKYIHFYSLTILFQAMELPCLDYFHKLSLSAFRISSFQSGLCL